MTDADESSLITRCQGGDQEAFAALVERYQRMVYGLAMRLTGSATEAEDLTQDVFLRVHRGLPYFRHEARLGTWIYRIVMNACSQRSTGRGAPSVSLDERDERGRLKFEPGATPELARQLEERDLVRKALSRLPAQYQVVIAAHYLEGVKYEDLAEALGVPLGTVKTHLHRGRRLLREALEDMLAAGDAS